MKQTGRVGRRSLFWSRLLGTLIAFAIIAVLVFGGVRNLMGELSAVYQALAESQSELAITQHELGDAQRELASAENVLDTTRQQLEVAENKLELQARLMQESARALDVASAHIQKLRADREDLKRGLYEAARELAHRNRLLKTRDVALSAARAELQRIRQQPKLSLVVTSERMLQTHYRERFAASHVRFLASGDDGALFFEGKTVEHEVEKSAVYGERTQIVITQTAPGHDVLECLNDASKGCARIIEARVSQHQLAYAYQSQFSGVEMRWLAASG